VPIKIKHEKELAKLGAMIDPNNPSQAVPISDIFQNGNYEEMPTDALIAQANKLFASVLSAERRLVALYWQLGDVLRAIRKQHEHGSWMDFVKQQGWNYKRVWQAITIRDNIETPEGLEDLTVAEALSCDKEKDSEIDPTDVARNDDGRKESKHDIINTTPVQLHVVGYDSVPDTQDGGTENNGTTAPVLKKYMVQFVLHCSMAVEAADEASARGHIEEDDDLLAGMDTSHLDGIEVLRVVPFEEYLRGEKDRRDEAEGTHATADAENH
jgi:hypothetical protein